MADLSVIMVIPGVIPVQSQGDPSGAAADPGVVLVIPG